MLFKETVKPKPFVKLAGGKRQLIDMLLANLPCEYNTYIESFVGGGALLIEVLPQNAIINDINFELINTYRVIKHYVDELIKDLMY